MATLHLLFTHRTASSPFKHRTSSYSSNPSHIASHGFARHHQLAAIRHLRIAEHSPPPPGSQPLSEGTEVKRCFCKAGDLLPVVELIKYKGKNFKSLYYQFINQSGRQIFYVEMEKKNQHFKSLEGLEKLLLSNNRENNNDQFWRSCSLVFVISAWFSSCQVAQSSVGDKTDLVYEIGELFELGIQLSYLLILLSLLGLGTFFVIRQVLVRRELDLSAKELQEQVRSGDGTATEYFELGAVMLRRKFYPAATKYLLQAIEKWDKDDQDLAQVYNALGVSYVRDNKVEKGIAQFEAAVKLQPGYVTAWNNMGDAYEKKKNLKMALRAFEQVLLFDPNNKIARPRRDALRERVQLYKGVPLKSEER